MDSEIDKVLKDESFLDRLVLDKTYFINVRCKKNWIEPKWTLAFYGSLTHLNLLYNGF